MGMGGIAPQVRTALKPWLRRLTSYHTKRILPNQSQQSKNEELTNLGNKNAEHKREI